MPYGKIVAINGANISISVQSPFKDSGPVINGKDKKVRHLGITLPACCKADIDYAVINIGDAVEFNSVMGKIRFAHLHGKDAPEDKQEPA